MKISLKPVALNMVVLLVALVGGAADRVNAATPERWTTLAQLNTPHELCAALTVRGKVYALGGFDVALEQFDPQTGRWTVLTNMMTERNFFGLAKLGNALAAIGGSSRTNDFHATVEV